MRTGGQANGKMLVFWYTYDAQRRPIWLVSNNLQPDATIGTSTSGTWSSALNRVRWTNATDTGLGTSESGRPITEAIGEVSVRFVQNDSNRMAIRWRWLGHDRIECIYNFTRVSDFGGPAPSSLNVNSTNSGAYFEPTLDGYGSNLNIFQQTIGGVLKYQELHTLAIYDGRGSPVWVQGLREPPASVIPTDVPETINLNYFTSNYPGGVPLTACGRGTSGPCNSLVPNVGTLRRTFASVHGFHVDLDVEIPSNEIPGNGPAVSWHRPYGSTAPVYMTKLTDKDSILVDRLSCTAPPGATTCSVSVNWTSTNLGARAFRVNLDTGAHQLLLDAGGQATFSGERLDDLSVGARYRYQLHQCTEDQASQCPGGVANFNSPVFATTHQVKAIGSIAVPDAPIQSLAGELPAHDATIGAIDAQAGVSGGAATYTIPIKVPPGRRGMQPSLALSYSSRSGNGIAGMGWSLSGLSSVHRCPRTVAQDGYPRAVDFSALDALCLDGQRLIVKSGSAGNPGATYATEIDSFARITQLGGG
ncbi:MAG: hypothetical protein LH616_19650, partial [Ilumatobacteraceae bacterium]|nr:hypothetical protein [Ilumatobacteraceae bacterium]